MSRHGFHVVLNWLKAERATYQSKKFDYVEEVNKPVEYWIQQFDSYIQRLPAYGLSSPLGVQAALKLAATAVALCEHLADGCRLPQPGFPSGEIVESLTDSFNVHRVDAQGNPIKVHSSE